MGGGRNEEWEFTSLPAWHGSWRLEVYDFSYSVSRGLEGPAATAKVPPSPPHCAAL